MAYKDSEKRPVASLPRPLSGELRLSAVLSSYVGDEKRLVRLRQCLESVVHQTQKPAAFYLVWSAPESLTSEVQSLLLAFKGRMAGTTVHCLQQSKRTSQFYDIRWLYQECISKELTENTWLLFSDDDDLWGPERIRLYGIIIDQHGRVPGVTAVCATHKVRPKDPKKVAMTPKEVQEQLMKGEAMHCGGVHQEEEFFDFACPASSLGIFLEMCNEETLLHPFCDLRFSRFLQEYHQGGKVMYFPTDKANPWVYYYATAYRTPEDTEIYHQFVDQDQASTVVKSRKEDRIEAKELCKKLGGKPGDAELEEMTEFVAALRQNIEAILIRHFPETPMKVGEMKRIAVSQAQGQLFALKLAEKLARQACEAFGVALE